MTSESSLVTPPSREPVLGDGLALEPRRPLIRRLGRSALRLFRPVVAPLLNRVDLRMRWSLDRTATADAVRALAGAVHDLAEAGRVHQAQTLARLDQARADIASAVAELRSEVTIRLDALALSHLRTLTFETSLAAVEERLVAGQQAVHIDLAERYVTIADGLHGQRSTVAQLVQDRSMAVALDGLIQRTDVLLRRRSVPLGTEIAVRTDYGYVLVPLEDEALLVAMVETSGRLEPGTLSVMLSLLHPGDIMLDVGANIGTLCLPAARKVGANGRIVALEPTPRTVSVLRRSIALNGLDDRVELLQYAAGEAEGVGRLAVSSATSHNSLIAVEEGGEHVEVSIRTLDACVPAGQAVNLAKLDVEGAELAAWRGMARIIAESPDLAVIIEFGPSHLKRWGITIADWLAMLRAPGFALWEIDEATGVIRPLREQGLAEVYTLNLLLLRQPPTNWPDLRVA